MKKIKYLLLILFLLPITVNGGTANWSDKIVWSDGTTSSGTKIVFWNNNYNQKLSQTGIKWFNNNGGGPYYLDFTVVVADYNLYTGSVVNATFYILTNFGINTGKLGYYPTYDSENDHITITKVANDVKFINYSGTGTVYKLTVSFQNQDCWDSDWEGNYVCYSDGYSRGVYIGSVTTSYDYAIQLYSFGEVTYSDLIYSQPDNTIDKDLSNEASLSVWDTIKALPGKLLSWFSELPQKIWNFMSSGFNFIGDSIEFIKDNLFIWFGNIGNWFLELPGNIWSGIKTGFTWITDGLSSLGDLIGGFFAALLDGIKDLFVPSSLSVDNLVDSFKSKLGFIYDIPYQVISFGLNLTNFSYVEMTSVYLPSISIFGYNFWLSQDIDITIAVNTFKPFRYLTDVLCVGLCVNTFFRFKDRIFGGSGGDYK